jgi:hypothetical protein
MNSVKEQILSGSSFKTAIPSQVRKALVEFWGSEEIINHPEIIVELGPDCLSRITRIGSKSIRQIAQALESLGYINSASQWLIQRTDIQTNSIQTENLP